MALDPYSPCPCGSGKKYKWCCHTVEADAERIERLIDNGQHDAALTALREALRKSPNNPLLGLKLGLLLVHTRRMPEARECVRALVAAHPSHPGAQNFLVRILVETDGPNVALGQLQHALDHLSSEDRKGLVLSAQLVGSLLLETGSIPAALKVLELAASLAPQDAERGQSAAASLRAIEADTSHPLWLRNPDRLSPAPAGLNPHAAERFAEALRLADTARWAAAAVLFDQLSREGTPESDRNLGILRLWLADHVGAVASLRRYTGWVGPSEAAVDLESLCQLIAPPRLEDVVENLQLIWPLRRRDDLLGLLRNDRRYIADGPGPIDPRDPDSPTVEQFRWLDRPQVESLTGLGLDDVPRVLARVLVGSEIVALETFDDGGMADRQARFMEEFAGMVPPAHPRSKTLGRVPRAAHAMEIEWALPDEAAPSDIERLSALERTRLMTQVWPKTALPALRGRTPRQAAKAGDATLPLQAALRILERSGDAWRDQIDLAPLRAELGLAPEQPIAIEHAHIATIHLARLCQLPIETLDDEGLIAVFRRAQRYMVLDVVERSARAILERPALLDSGKLDRVTVFSSLAHLARSRGDNDQAMIWIKQGRETEPAADRTKNAVRWDVIELRLRASTEAPEAWVPTLAALLERVRDDKTAGSYVLTTLLDLGLVQPVQNPDRPEEILLDSRVLQAMLARYGPRITTAEGELAVSASAAKGEVWTPEKDAAGRSGTIWTPGTDSASGSSEAKPGLIIPGR